MCLLHLVFFVTFGIILASNKDLLKEAFEKMEGDIAVTRDYCFESSSTTFDDLKRYENNDDVPEKLACFFKCLYHQVGVIDENGTVDVDGLINLPGFDETKFDEVKECLKEVGVVKSCDDMKKAGPCINLAVELEK